MKTLRPLSRWFLLITLLGAGRAALAQDAKPGDSSPGGARAASTQRISTAAAAVLRTSPFDPPEASDISFFNDAAPGLDTGCTFRSGGPLVYQIEIKRFLGELNPDGTLKDAAALVAAGLLSPTVKLVMPSFDIDSGPPPPDVAPEVDRVSFNGQPIGVLSGQNNQWVLNSFEIPIEKIKFAQRGAAGGEPVGGVNEIRIDIDTANLEQVWCTSVDWGSASFKASSPIILIHGNASDGGFFERMGFTAPLDNLKLVYRSVDMETKSRLGNAHDLSVLIPAVMRSLGAKNVHLVTHSKGGLDAREYLERYYRFQRSLFKVLSLTTLSGPHDGSIGADLRIAHAKAANVAGRIEYVGFPEYTNALAEMMKPDEATPSLTTNAAATFNPRNVPRLHGLGIIYNTVGADADRNSNLQIDRDPDEFVALRDENLLLRLLYKKDPEEAQKYVDAMYQIVRHTAGLIVAYRESNGERVATILKVYPSPDRENDTMVSVDSARGDGGFHTLVSNYATFEGFKGRNHADVADGEIGVTVLNWILDIEVRTGGLR
jgi:pimeloyl-ACP methyl ester carboxylesterase